MICDYIHKNICICVTGFSKNLETASTFAYSILMTNLPESVIFWMSSLTLLYITYHKLSITKQHTFINALGGQMPVWVQMYSLQNPYINFAQTESGISEKIIYLETHSDPQQNSSPCYWKPEVLISKLLFSQKQISTS